MKRIIVAWTTATLMAGAAAAQQASPGDSEPGRAFAWFVSIGGEKVGWGDLKSAFNSAGYNQPATNVLHLGGGGYGLSGRWLIGGEGYGFAGQEVSSAGGHVTRVSGGAGFANLGYLLVDHPMHRVYPFIGIGGTGVSLRVEAAGGTGLGPNLNTPTFAQVLLDPGRRSVLSTGGLALEVGVGAEVIPVTRRRAKGTYGLLVGVRAGYQFAPVRGDWKLYDVGLTGGPNHIGDGFFVRFSIGGAGRVIRQGERCGAMSPEHHATMHGGM